MTEIDSATYQANASHGVEVQRRVRHFWWRPRPSEAWGPHCVEIGRLNEDGTLRESCTLLKAQSEIQSWAQSVANLFGADVTVTRVPNT